MSKSDNPTKALTLDVFTTCVPELIGPPEDDYPTCGPYMTLEEFLDGVECGVFGPDEACSWVYITEDSNLATRPIKHPNEVRPPRTIAVAYYDA